MNMKQGMFMSGSGLLPAGILAVALVVLVNTGVTGVRLDLTEAKLYTLSEGTENILSALDEPVQLDFYFSRKTLDGFPSMINYGNRVADLLREYAAKSGGMIKLNVIEPEPFSEAEDQAVASGLQGVAVNAAGDNAYFGLVGRNSVDDEKVIAFFQNQREASLEYDLTKLIYNLAYPKKRQIGVISGLPVFGDQMMPGQAPGPSQPWTIIETMREFFDVRELETVTDDVDVLMVIHPKNLPEQTLFDIDQFILGGGKAMLFVDPLAEMDNTGPDPQNPAAIPEFGSHLDRLLNAWGLGIPREKVVGDMDYAMRVQTRSPRGQAGVLYLPWLGLRDEALNVEDFTTNELEVVNAGSAGVIEKQENSTLNVVALLKTSTQTMLLDRTMLQFQQDPESMLTSFVSENKQRDIAVRLSGHAVTAFPEGAPRGEGNEAESGGSHLTEGEINVILVADTDLLSDMFWVRSQNFLGTQINQAIANNGDFIINALDNLSGNNDLISLRSRGEFSRPFTRVEEIRREAEEKFREREQQLQDRLKETEQRILALQNESGANSMILSPEQAVEIDKFRAEMIVTRKELREVQHELQKNIESLGSTLRFINIGLVPLLITVISIVTGVYRSRHYN